MTQAVDGALGAFAKTLGSWFAGLLNGALNADSSIKIFASGDKTGAFANSGFATQFTFWLTVMAAVVLVVGLGQIVVGMVMGSPRRIAQVGLSMLASIPVTLLALLGMEQANAFVNAVTDSFLKLLETGSNGDTLTNAVLNMTGLRAFDVPASASGSPWYVSPVGGQVVPYAALGSLLMTILVLLLLIVACGFLCVAMLVRIFSLAVLAVLAPIGLMFVGQPKFHGWAKGWVEIVLGLLLAKPLAAGIIGISVAIVAGDPTSTQLASGQTTTDFFGVIAGFVGLLIASASPIATIALARFTGNAIEHAGGRSATRAAGGVVRNAASTAQMRATSAIQSRLAASRAGRSKPAPSLPRATASAGSNGAPGQSSASGGAAASNGSGSRSRAGGRLPTKTAVPRRVPKPPKK